VKFSVTFKKRTTFVQVVPVPNSNQIKVSLLMPGCGCEPYYTMTLIVPFELVDKEALRKDLANFARTQIGEWTTTSGQTYKVNYCPWCGQKIEEAMSGVKYATA
jgi:hypothetical protein